MKNFYTDSLLRDTGPEAWGWHPELFAHWSAWCSTGTTLVPARILAREHHHYELVIPDFRERASLPDYLPRMTSGSVVSGKFQYLAQEGADYPVVGDWALVDPNEEKPRIQALLPRRTSLVRARAGTTTESQVLLANIDTILIVFALDGGRNFLTRLLERALVVVRSGGGSTAPLPLIILNKADLASSEEKDWAVSEARRIAPDVPVLLLSARSGEGIDTLLSFMQAGQTMGMLGKSGVGKSALVNAIASHEESSLPRAAEGRVREDDRRGRHTTTSSRIRRLESGVLLADSPGIRELKLWDEALASGKGSGRAETNALDESFPEIASAVQQCRFGDCKHEGEPGCAVAEALANGDITTERFLAWLELKREENWLATRVSEQARMKEKAKWKEISKYQKALKKARRYN